MEIDVTPNIVLSKDTIIEIGKFAVLRSNLERLVFGCDFKPHKLFRAETKVERLLQQNYRGQSFMESSLEKVDF